MSNWKPIRTLRKRQLIEDTVFVFFKEPAYVTTGIVDCDCEVILHGQYFGYSHKVLKDMFDYYQPLDLPEE